MEIEVRIEFPELQIGHAKIANCHNLWNCVLLAKHLPKIQNRILEKKIPCLPKLQFPVAIALMKPVWHPNS